MKAPRNWKQLERHPLSAEFENAMDWCRSKGLSIDDVISLRERMERHNCWPPKSRIGHIYFIRIVEHPLVKIGWALSPQFRLNELQTGCPFQMFIEHEMRGCLEEEKYLHSRFAHLHFRGEWFSWADEIAQFIAKEGRP